MKVWTNGEKADKLRAFGKSVFKNLSFCVFVCPGYPWLIKENTPSANFQNCLSILEVKDNWDIHIFKKLAILGPITSRPTVGISHASSQTQIGLRVWRLLVTTTGSPILEAKAEMGSRGNVYSCNFCEVQSVQNDFYSRYTRTVMDENYEVEK